MITARLEPCVQIIQINLVLKNSEVITLNILHGSNNTNKLSPQEQKENQIENDESSNNTNKLSPQERAVLFFSISLCSNNTNKLSPQEHKLKNCRKL